MHKKSVFRIARRISTKRIYPGLHIWPYMHSRVAQSVYFYLCYMTQLCGDRWGRDVSYQNATINGFKMLKQIKISFSVISYY